MNKLLAYLIAGIILSFPSSAFGQIADSQNPKTLPQTLPQNLVLDSQNSFMRCLVDTKNDPERIVGFIVVNVLPQNHSYLFYAYAINCSATTSQTRRPIHLLELDKDSQRAIQKMNKAATTE